jgi:hypothetical protein
MTMMDETERSQSLPMVELNALRMEAMAIYERCLNDSTTAAFERFLERHLVETPPPVALLNEISDDLFQRLQSLRQSEFDVRDRLLEAALREFQVELGEALPLRDLDLLAAIHPAALADSLPAPLDAANRAALVIAMEAARQAAFRLAVQRNLTEQLYASVMDWATALHVITMREQWRPPHERIVQNVWSATL